MLGWINSFSCPRSHTGSVFFHIGDGDSHTNCIPTTKRYRLFTFAEQLESVYRTYFVFVVQKDTYVLIDNERTVREKKI